MQATLISFMVSASVLGADPANSHKARPNVLVILADDLGFSDLGCYGGEIETPNLDGLAANGLRFLQFYNTARCWPTRAALLTGYYAQQVRRDTVPGVPHGGRGVRPPWAMLLPEMLAPAGYRAYHSGKWHVDGEPTANGFHHSYLLKDQGRFFSPRVHFLDDRPLPAVERSSGFYATTAIADHAVKCLKEHAQHYPDQSFFHYLAFTAPHFPLHALQQDIDRYRDRYRVGWEAIRAARYQRQRSEGIVDATLSEVEQDVGPPYVFPDALPAFGPNEVDRPLPWRELTQEQQHFQATKMAIHAAMVDRMDREIGRVLAQLRDMQAWDNTLILFLSDNGASAEIMVRADGHDRLAELGSAATHLCLGPGWSTTCNTPFRRHKTWVHEGGIATPLIVHWPAGTQSRGELRTTSGHVIDLVPTILDVAGVPTPKRADGEAIPPSPGLSLRGVIESSEPVQREYLWWSHEGNRALIKEDWKLVAAGEEGPWELYNLRQDRTETTNLVEQHPDKVRELAQFWVERRDEFIELATRHLPETSAESP